MTRGAEHGFDHANRLGASGAGDLASASNTNAGAAPRKLRRCLLWAGGGTALAICIAILLLWGIYGPTYLFDLIAAYCA